MSARESEAEAAQVSRLTGRAGLVTGASRGIGKAIAHRLAAEGATVVACARSQPKLEAVASSEADAPGVVIARVADVTKEAEVVRLVEELETDFGGPDFIVNNAGLWLTQRLADMTIIQWEEIEAVNVRAVLWGCKHAIAAMVRRGSGGSVVNIGSINALAGLSQGVGYTMTKHAVLGLTRAIACDPEYVQAGIRVNCVCPGDIETDMIREYWASTEDPTAAQAEMEGLYPSNRLGRPDEIAAVVAFLVSDDSTLVNGSTIVADGGLTARLY